MWFSRPMMLACIALSFLLPAGLATAQAPEFRPGGAVTNTNPQPVRLRCWNGTDWQDCTLSGGGGGGGGDASAANQVTQITAAQATNTTLGAVTASPAANTIGDRLKTGNTSLGSIDTKLPASLGAKAGSASLSVAPATDAAFDTVVKATATDRGLVVTAAGTAQQLMAANASRRGFSVQNQSSGACYINGQATATQDYHSLQIAAGAYYDTPPTHVGTGAVSIVCAAASASVYAREW